MDAKARRRIQLDCLYEMFRDRIEENVVYFVYTENDGKIDTTIDHLMSMSACALTGYHFEPPLASSPTLATSASNNNGYSSALPTTSDSPSCSSNRSAGHPTTRKGTSKQANINNNDLASNGHSTKSDFGDDSERGDQDDQDDSDLDIDERISRIQNSIEKLLTEKATCHDKASQYLSKKMYQVTSYYSELSSHCRRMIETKTRKLIDLLLQKSENANTIDLHGLNPIQAKLVVSELLNIRQDQLSIDKQGETNIDIITGWGKHTVKMGQHRIRPTIVALLKEKGYQFYHLNKGALRVTIRR